MRHTAGGLLWIMLLATASVKADETRPDWGPWNPKASQRPRLSLRQPVPVVGSNATTIQQIGLAKPQPVSGGFDSSVVRAQGTPPPPPPPPPGAALGAEEAFNCGVVGREPGVQGFFQRCYENTRDWIYGVPAATVAIFQPGQDRGIFESDHDFDGFISPISNPFYNEDPRALTEIRPIFIWQQTPQANPVFGGGSNFFYGTQLRLAVTERFSLVFQKLGGITTEVQNPNPALSSNTGFAELHLGPKFTIIRNDYSNTLLASGLTFEVPAGSSDVAQDTGDLSLRPYISFGQKLFPDFTYGSFNFINTTGYSFRTDNVRSEMFFSAFHIDFDIGNFHRYYPTFEINWFHYARNGNAGDIFGFEGADMFNFGAGGVAGRDELLLEFGGRYKYTEQIQFGIAAGFNALGGGRNLNNFRLTTDMIFRY